jgi:hypothetical protein
MKKIVYLMAIPLWLIFFSKAAHAQEIDTLVDVGGYKLHFEIQRL